ncbi:MAG: ABC transporter permease [Dehalococcoidales bacterium]|nr:ABC transporter permease [Dehalococcoidales bacterium]
MNRRVVLLAVGVLLVIWQLAAMLVSQEVLPGPLAVLAVIPRELARGLGWHIAVSGYRVIAGIVLATVTAAPLGLVAGQSKRLDGVVSPMVYLTYPVPKIVFLPLAMLFLGIGDLSKIFLIWLILFFQVLVVVRDASQGVRPETTLSVRSLRAGRLQLLRYVYLPACLPAILTALRVSTGTAIAVLFFAESFATQSGLGYYIIVEAWGRMAYPEMYAGVLAMSALGMSLYLVLDAAERHLCAWVQAGR